MLHLTDSAVAYLSQILSEPGVEAGSGLRLYVEKGGCAGLSYAMKIGQPQAGDSLVERGGARLLVDAASLSVLRGSEVDYVDTLSDSGFKIRNPNAARSCGCGTSFEPAESGLVEASESLPDGSCRT